MKAFTFLEIIIVLGAITALMVLGAAGLTSFRGLVEVQSAYSNFVTNAKTLQNFALNSNNTNQSTVSLPDLYAFFIQDNGVSYKFYTCDITEGTTNFSCTQSEAPTLIQYSPTSVNLVFANTVQSGFCSTMKGIGFERLTGDLFILNALSAVGSSVTGQYTTNGLCNLNLTHTTAGQSSVLILDLTSNRIN